MNYPTGMSTRRGAASNAALLGLSLILGILAILSIIFGIILALSPRGISADAEKPAQTSRKAIYFRYEQK